MALNDVEEFEESLQEIRKLEKDFANYLCEDANRFKIEEVFSIFKQFCDNINTARKVCSNRFFMKSPYFMFHLIG